MRMRARASHGVRMIDHQTDRARRGPVPVDRFFMEGISCGQAPLRDGPPASRRPQGGLCAVLMK